MDLTQTIAKVLDQLFSAGWKPPIRLAVIAANGGAMVATYYDPGDDTGLACRIELATGDDQPLALPINMMFVERTGEAARVVIENERQTAFTIQ